MKIFKRIIKLLTILIILGFGVYLSSLLNIHIAWIVTISLIWVGTMLIFFTIIDVNFLSNPKRFLTDYGYQYISISEIIPEDNGSKTKLCLYNDYFFYWKVMNEVIIVSSRIKNDIDLKNQMNILCTPKKLTNYERTKRIFNEIDVVTNKKEILRDSNVDKLLQYD